MGHKTDYSCGWKLKTNALYTQIRAIRKYNFRALSISADLKMWNKSESNPVQFTMCWVTVPLCVVLAVDFPKFKWKNFIFELKLKRKMAEFLFLNPTIISSQSINTTNDKPSKIVQLKLYKKVIPFKVPLIQTKKTISKELRLKIN